MKVGNRHHLPADEFQETSNDAWELVPAVQELYLSIGHLLDSLETPALLLDALSEDCPVVGASMGFCLLSGYALEELLGQRRSIMFQGVPNWAISLSARKNEQDFYEMCRVKGLSHLAEVHFSQVNARRDGTPFVSFCMLGVCNIGKRVLILCVAMSLGEGMSGHASADADAVVEPVRSTFKATRAYLQANVRGHHVALEVGEDSGVKLNNAISGPPAFAFFAERLQDHCLLVGNDRTAIRREAAEVPSRCLVFSDRPMMLTGDGLSFSVRIEEVTPLFEGFPLIGFTRKRPSDSPTLYPMASRCVGASVLIGGCGEAFARDDFEHLELGFKPPSQDELQHWVAQPTVPSHKRKPHVKARAGDIIRCTYSCDGHLKLYCNGNLMWGFDLERHIDETANYYAVVDVCLSICSLTVLPQELMDKPTDSVSNANTTLDCLPDYATTEDALPEYEDETQPWSFISGSFISGVDAT